MSLVSSVHVSSPLGSYDLEHLPENPEEIPNVKIGHELLTQGRQMYAKTNDFQNAEVLKCYQSALKALSSVYACVKAKKEATFPIDWAHFFRWKASCECTLKEDEKARQSWRHFIAIISSQRPLSEEEKEVTRNFFLSIGKRAAEQNNNPLAIEYFSEGIKIIGSDIYLHFEKYKTHLKLGQYVEAIYDLLEAEKCHLEHPVSGKPIALYFFGVYYKRIGMFDLAAQYFQNAEKQFQELGNDPKAVQDCADKFLLLQKIKKGVVSKWEEMQKTSLASTSWIPHLQAVKKSVESFQDGYHLAIACKEKGQLEDALIYVKKAKELAATSEERKESVFLANAIRREWLRNFGVTESSSTSWFPRSIAAYKAVKTCKDAYYLAMAYLSEEQLVDAQICIRKAKEIARKDAERAQSLTERLETALIDSTRVKKTPASDEQVKVCAFLADEIQEELQEREPKKEEPPTQNFSRISTLLLRPAVSFSSSSTSATSQAAPSSRS